jgi:hypothetical protein
MLPEVAMRCIALTLALSLALPLTASAADGPKPAASEEVVPAYAPLAAVAVMLKTGQALVFDDTADRYRLVMVGDVVAGWKVVAIEAGKIVVVHGEERDELELEPPPRPIEGIKLPASAQVAPAPARPAEKPADRAGGLEDPYAERKPEPVKPEPVKPAPRPAVPPQEDELVPTRRLSRGELNREISDFEKLDAAVDFQPAPGGGFELTRVEKASFIARLGLREGDVVRAVSGQRVASVDDAARVYATLRSAKAFTIELDRLVPATADAPASRRRVILSFQVTAAK